MMISTLKFLINLPTDVFAVENYRAVYCVDKLKSQTLINFIPTTIFFSFSGVKRPGYDADHPPPTSAGF